MTNDITLEAIGQLIDHKLKPLDSRIDGLGTRMDGLDSRMDGLGARMDSLDVRMAKTEISIENDIKVKLDLILKMLTPIAQKVKEVEKIPAMQEDISLLKTSVRHLADELQKLKNA